MPTYLDLESRIHASEMSSLRVIRSLKEAQEARERVTLENVTRLFQERARGTST